MKRKKIILLFFILLTFTACSLKDKSTKNNIFFTENIDSNKNNFYTKKVKKSNTKIDLLYKIVLINNEKDNLELQYRYVYENTRMSCFYDKNGKYKKHIHKDKFIPNKNYDNSISICKIIYKEFKSLSI